MSISPKKLSIDEIWKLHNILDIQDLGRFEYFIDSLLDLLKQMDIQKINQALKILYKKNKKENGLVIANKLLYGLKENDFFAFEHLIREINV